MRLGKENNKDTILNGSIIAAILVLAIPTFFNGLLQMTYNLADTYWLGVLGTKQMAGINVITQLQQIVVNFGNGITTAGSVIIGTYIGANNRNGAKKVANQIFGCSMIFAIAASALLFLITPQMCTWLGAIGDTWVYAKTYLQVELFDIPFLYMINIYSSINHAEGNTFKPMLMNLVGVVLNLIFDPVFMIVLNLGVMGTALATLVAKMIPAIICFIILSRRSGDEIGIDLKNIRFEKSTVSEIIKIGFPAALASSSMNFGLLLLTKNVLTFGDAAVAAYGIGNKINGLMSLPSSGFGTALSTIVAMNMGAGNIKRIDKAYKYSMAIICAFLLIVGFIVSRPFICTPIVNVFSRDPLVVSMAVEYLSLMSLLVFSNGVQDCSMALFKGSGHTEITFIISVIRLWVFRFLILYICESVLHLGVKSVWICVVGSNILSPLCLVILYFMGYWKKSRIKMDN